MKSTAPRPATASDDDKPAVSVEIEQAVQDQVHCRNCSLSGLVTIFRKPSKGCDGYDGLPACELIDRNGEVKQVRARIIAHCKCLVGECIRGLTTAHLCRRIPTLRAVGVKGLGMENWSQHDPRFPPLTADEQEQTPDWKTFRVWIESEGRKGKRPVQKVYPESNGNRREAYCEMAESLPEKAPQTARDWRSLPPVPDVAAMPELVAAFVPDGSDVPF